MKKTYLILPILFILITGCETTKPKVNLTPLEIQSIQSRSYEHPKKTVFPSVMSVFQDLGYSINSADINTGLITAESIAESNKALKFWLNISKVSITSDLVVLPTSRFIWTIPCVSSEFFLVKGSGAVTQPVKSIEKINTNKIFFII